MLYNGGIFVGDRATGSVTGSGTANTIPIWTTASALGNSVITQNAAATAMLFTPGAAASGAITAFTFTVASNTNQTATGIPGVLWTMPTRQYAGSGIIGTQYEYLITAPTYSAGGTTTITDAATLRVSAPVASTNVTITNPWAAMFSGAVSISGVIATSGIQQGFVFTGAANTNQTASTEINGVLWTTTSRQWGTGAITEQNEFKITSPTYSFVGASVITDASTLRVFAPTVGANATLTRANSLYLSHLTAASTYLKVYEATTTIMFMETGTSMVLSAVAGSVAIRLYGATRYSFGVNVFTGTPIASSGSITNAFVFTSPINTNQTASTERSSILWTLSGREWATGAIGTQREFLLTAPTYSFVGASVITNAYTFYSIAPIQGTNATLTNSYAAGFEGNVKVGLNQSATTSLRLENTTSATTSRCQLLLTSSAFVGGVNMLSAGWTTSGINVADCLVINSNSTAGINLGTSSAGQVSIWTTNIQRIVVTDDGRFYGTGLHNNAGAVTGTATQYIASGTYTPTLTNTANIDSSTAYLCQWHRVGNVVTVSGKVDIDATTTLTLTQLGISFPIASTITATQNCAGAAAVGVGSERAAAILGDVANTRASLELTILLTTAETWYFTFTYLIL